MSQTFSFFSSLPWELRHEIWTLALRSEERGVHFSGVRDRNCSDDNGMIPFDDFARPCMSNLTFYQLTAPAPRLPTGTSHKSSWTTNNPSSYLHDGGMWTACKESRAVMERRYRDKHWRAVRKSRRDDPSFEQWVVEHPKDPCPEEHLRISSMGYFLEKGSRQYFNVLPELDLFFLQADGLENELIHHDPIEGHSLWESDGGFRGPRNLAFEYNPAWWAIVQKEERDKNGRVKVLEEFAKRSANAIETDVIWLVDYTLKRKASPATSRDRVVFEGLDRRYVEVVGCHIKQDDMGDEFETDSGSLEFYRAVEEAGQEMQEHPPRGYEFLCEMRAPFGLLACEFF